MDADKNQKKNTMLPPNEINSPPTGLFDYGALESQEEDLSIRPAEETLVPFPDGASPHANIEATEGTGQNPNGRINKFGKKILGAAFGIGLIITSTISLLHDKGHQSSERQLGDKDKTEQTAEPTAPLETTTSTAVKSVQISPEAVLPTTTVVVNVPEKTTTTTPESLKTPERAQLPSAEVEKIRLATGYEGLSGRKLSVIERYEGTHANIVIVSVDGGEMTVPLETFQKYVTAAEGDVEQPKTITVPMRLGPGPAGVQDMEFKVSSSQLRKPPLTQYYFFTKASQDTSELASPQPVPGSGYAFTINRPYQDMTVTILKPQSGANAQGISYAKYNALAEVLQANRSYELTQSGEQKLLEASDVSYITSTTGVKKLQDARTEALLRGREVDVASRSIGWLFPGSTVSYSESVPKIGLIDPEYVRNELHLFAVPLGEVGMLN